MTKLEKIKSDEASKEFIVLLFAVMFAILSVIFHFNPLMVDDYEFLSYNYQSFGEAINCALCYGNGRFLGNLGAILLAPHTIIAAVFKAFTVSLLCILLPKLFDATKKTTYLLSCLLILAVPEKMFAQVHAWNCGNVNYISPILLTIFCFLILKSESKGGFVTVLKCFGIFFLGFCSQLFMEHNTLVNFLMAASLFLFLTIKRKSYGNEKCIVSFFWTVATALGTVAMLMIPKFFVSEHSKDMSGYRGIGITNLRELMYRLYLNTDALVSHFASNLVLILVLGIVTFLLLKCTLKKTRHKTQVINFLKLGNIICVCFDLIYCLFIKNITVFQSKQNICKVFFGIICALEVLIFFITCLMCLQSKQRIISLICLILFICSVAPFLIIHPVRERTSFLGMTILIFAAVYFFNETVQTANIIREIKQRIIIIGTIAAVICCLFVSFYSINGYMKSLYTYIESQMQDGSNVIEIFQAPVSYSFNNTVMLKYRYYYQEVGDIQFKIIPFDEWFEKRSNEESAELQSQPQQ